METRLRNQSKTCWERPRERPWYSIPQGGCSLQVASSREEDSLVLWMERERRNAPSKGRSSNKDTEEENPDKNKGYGFWEISTFYTIIVISKISDSALITSPISDQSIVSMSERPPKTCRDLHIISRRNLSIYWRGPWNVQKIQRKSALKRVNFLNNFGQTTFQFFLFRIRLNFLNHTR